MTSPLSFVSPAGTTRRLHDTSLCIKIQGFDQGQGRSHNYCSKLESCCWISPSSSLGLVLLTCLLSSHHGCCFSREGKDVIRTSCPIGRAHILSFPAGVSPETRSSPVIKKKRSALIRTFFRWRGLLTHCVSIVVREIQALITSDSCGETHDKNFNKRSRDLRVPSDKHTIVLWSLSQKLLKRKIN